MCVRAAARSGGNSHILRSLNRSSEVNSAGHRLWREVFLALQAAVHSCSIFLAFVKRPHVSCPFKPLSIFRLLSCSNIAAKLEIITNSVSPFLPVKKR